MTKPLTPEELDEIERSVHARSMGVVGVDGQNVQRLIHTIRKDRERIKLLEFGVYITNCCCNCMRMSGYQKLRDLAEEIDQGRPIDPPEGCEQDPI
jgi:hypothetical protein